MTLQELVRHPDFWSLYRASGLHEDHVSEDPAGTHIDGTARGALVDWLHEAGHAPLAAVFARALTKRPVIRSANEPDLYRHEYGNEKTGGFHIWPAVYSGFHGETTPGVSLTVLRPKLSGPTRPYQHDTQLHVPLTKPEFHALTDHLELEGHAAGWPTEVDKWHRWVDKNTTKTPLKLARPGAKSVVRDSAQNKARVGVARRILTEAGLTPSRVVAALHHSPAGVRSSTVQFVPHSDPETVRYAAAWYGLLAGEPKVTTFFPHSGGGDELHVLTTRQPAARTADAMKQMGVGTFTTHGPRTYVVNPSPDEAALLAAHARRTNARHSVIPGYAYPVGGGEGAAADAGSRSSYRSVIRDYEAAGKPGG